MTELTKDQIDQFARLEFAYNNSRLIETSLIQELIQFGKNPKEIIETMTPIIQSNDGYRVTYLQYQKLLPEMLLVAEGEDESTLVNPQSLDIAEDRIAFKKARETFVNDHLDQTSDTAQLQNLRDYVYGKAAAAVHQKDFKKDPALEALMKGCRICETYLDLSKKHIKGIQTLFGA